MTGHGQKLSRKRQAAIGALLVEPTVTAAARVVGIGEKTLRRWLAQPDFHQEFERATQVSFDAAVLRLRLLAAGAVETLSSGLRGEADSVQIRAARAVLDHIGRLQLAEVMRRLDEVERRTGEARGER